jgi:hypothetical protein
LSSLPLLDVWLSGSSAIGGLGACPQCISECCAATAFFSDNFCKTTFIVLPRLFYQVIFQTFNPNRNLLHANVTPYSPMPPPGKPRICFVH